MEVEYHRHRDHLEKSIKSMRHKIGAEQANHTTDTSRMIRENTVLVHEINEIRKEIINMELPDKKLGLVIRKTEKNTDAKLPAI